MMRKLFRYFETDRRNRINHIVAFFSGVIFFTGWWLMVDVHATNPILLALRGVYYLPGLFGTLGFIIVNSIPNNVLQPENFYDSNRCATFCGRFFLFFGFFVSFSSLIGAFYVCINDFALQDEVEAKWPGVGILLQNICIFAATFLYKFGIVFEEI